VARRTRQYPVDFGRSSTFVETIDRREIETAGQRLVHAMSYTGVVELEFKRDPQSGQYKLLDINPRIWGWHTLGQRAGVDFSLLLWRLTQGESFKALSGRSGVSWMRLSTDLPAALTEIWRGRLSAREYLKSFRGSLESAIFASDDLLPALLEMPLGAYVMLKRLCA
jgi:D-aspartate ligase